jgi:hypothetical protein
LANSRSNLGESRVHLGGRPAQEKCQEFVIKVFQAL